MCPVVEIGTQLNVKLSQFLKLRFSEIETKVWQEFVAFSENTNFTDQGGEHPMVQRKLLKGSVKMC